MSFNFHFSESFSRKSFCSLTVKLCVVFHFLFYFKTIPNYDSSAVISGEGISSLILDSCCDCHVQPKITFLFFVLTEFVEHNKLSRLTLSCFLFSFNCRKLAAEKAKWRFINICIIDLWAVSESKNKTHTVHTKLGKNENILRLRIVLIMCGAVMFALFRLERELVLIFSCTV